MREIRIYQAGDFKVGDLILLSSSASQHVAVVLRMRVGGRLTLFCGDNREFEARIEAVKKQEVSVKILAVLAVNRESSCRIHLAQAISKGERMDFVVQKAVELGVASVTPLITGYCSVKLSEERIQKKWQQWQNIAIAACEQSGRNIVPTIHPVVSLSYYLQKKQAGLRLLLQPGAKKHWRDYTWDASEKTLLIGPEGGWTEMELELLLTEQFLPLSLGPRVLRTETAAIVALSVLQALCGDL